MNEAEVQYKQYVKVFARTYKKQSKKQCKQECVKSTKGIVKRYSVEEYLIKLRKRSR